MIKIVATISDFGACANLGGVVTDESFIIEVPTRFVPDKVKKYLQSEQSREYQNMSLSILNEDFISND